MVKELWAQSETWSNGNIVYRVTKVIVAKDHYVGSYGHQQMAKYINIPFWV